MQAFPKGQERRSRWTDHLTALVGDRPTTKQFRAVWALSFGAFAIGMLLLSVAHSPATLLIAALVCGLGYGALLPCFQTIAVQATSTDTHVASIDHPDGAVIDGGHSFDQHDTASAASVHLHDDTSLRTSMDLLG